MLNSQITFIENNINAPKGFTSSGIAAGIKGLHALDLGLIYSERPAVAAGVFTLNKIKAAPLTLTQENLEGGILQAIIVNSGNANACTGEVGDLHAKQTIEALAKELNISARYVGISSTGVIGRILPIEKIINAIPKLVSKLVVDSTNSMAKSIMTTDLVMKEVAVEVTLTHGTIRIGGIAKGSGMIHPNMATMLGFITTDANIEQPVLQEALMRVTNKSFNMISVDGDTSTNDMVVIMANKMADNNPITSLDSPDGKIFYNALEQLSIILAKKIVEDGEGATKVIEVAVAGATNEEQAQIVAKSVIGSSLVKTAIFGNDANWGRIACAVGYADKDVDSNKLKIWLSDLALFANGVPLPFSEEIALELLKEKNVYINIDLGLGNSQALAWGCDMSYDYIKINASYRS
jgi:glutamate N-acetyltransferase/amino-acid N-acetyltransferase